MILTDSHTKKTETKARRTPREASRQSRRRREVRPRDPSRAFARRAVVHARAPGSGSGVPTPPGARGSLRRGDARVTDDADARDAERDGARAVLQARLA